MPIQIDFMYEYAKDLIVQFGYDHLFETVRADDGKMTHTVTEPITNGNDTGDRSWIRTFNKKSLDKSIHILYEEDEVVSMMINYAALLLRKKSQLYPEGRTSYRFKKELRKEVTVTGQSAFAPKKKRRLARPNELDLPETDERDDE